MRCLVSCIAVIMSACVTARAHDVITTKVTWSREISRIIYKRCASCHRDGGSSFSLLTYEEARPWAKAIKEEALERRMPPWGAVKGFGSFKDDQGLTQEDLEIISDWVEGGAPEGDPARLPPKPYLGPKPGHNEASGRELIVDGERTLKTPVTLTALEPKTVVEGASVQVIAERPDGSVEPLLWLYNYKPSFGHAYYLKTPLRLPAGTRIVCSPEKVGAISVFLTNSGGRMTSALKPGQSGSRQ